MKKYEIDYIQIKDKKMVRDMSNKAILSTDLNELKAYRDRKRSMENINSVREEINTTRAEMAEIKEMLKLLLAERK
jgi:F0F1-type ATP synthase epsilon subunit